MLLTNVMRFFLAHQIQPFIFQQAKDFLPDMSVPHFGLYVHIPFCKVLCPFCPYYKIHYEADTASSYLQALLREIDMVARKLFRSKKQQVTSLYFGGGSPALMIDDLHTIRNKINTHFEIEGNTGIELHPRDVRYDTAAKLADAGFDMVSIGIQSFGERLLSNLKRESIDADVIFASLRSNKFKAVDVDLIFGIPGQTEKDLQCDFIKAVELGATQISTYPFIDFSYADNSQKPQSHTKQKKLLSVLLETADKMNFTRTSVWTFGKKECPRYSSITRDCFLGFGPSATSLGKEAFKVNTFSVDEYIKGIEKNTIPTALKMQFTARTRKLYWLFWNCYNGTLYESEYAALFLSELKKDFSFWLQLGTITGLLQKTDFGWQLTDKGSYYFHWVEQEYTHQYIDKTWDTAMHNPWPEKLKLY